MRNRTSDEELLRRSRDGDPGAFRELADRYTADLKARIRLHLAPALRRKASAGDVLQEAYLVALQRIDDFEDRGAGSFGAWLGRIVELKTLEVVRRYAGAGKRDVGREITRAARPASGEIPGECSTPSQRAIAAETGARIEAALGELPPDSREVIRLIQELHLPLAEAARRLGRTPGATQKLYERALGRLAKRLELDR